MAEPLVRPAYGPLANHLRSTVIARYWFAGLVACLTVAGGVLRFTKLGESYWYDEAVTVGLVRSSLWSMIHALPGSESTPPLYYGIAWLWSRIFGTSEVALRSLSALVGAAAIPVAAAAGREFFSKSAGAIAGALVAASLFLVWYSQEARAYSLYVVLSALSLLLFARALRFPSRRRLVWWALASALAIWTEYFAGFLIAAEALVLFLSPRSRRHLAVPFLVLAVSTDRGTSLMLLSLGAAAVLLPLLARAPGRDYWIYRNVIDAYVPLAIAVAGGVVSRGRAPWYGRSVLGLLALAAISLLVLKSTEVMYDPHKRADWRGLAKCLGSPDSGRVFLVAPLFNGVVLKLYRPNVRRPQEGHVSVSQIDLIGDPKSVHVPAGFHFSGSLCTQTIAVRRLRARQPVSIPGHVEGATVLVDAPASTT